MTGERWAITIDEAAAVCGVPVSRVAAWIDHGRVAGFRSATSNERMIERKALQGFAYSQALPCDFDVVANWDDCPVCGRRAELAEYSGMEMCEQCVERSIELDDHSCSG
jgi:hypothetical protein